MPRPPDRLWLKRLDRDRYAFMPPALAIDRREDVDEVRRMIEMDEIDIAHDELLYLVSDCREFLEAHNLLAELALRDNDIRMARGHYGFSYETALQRLPRGFRGRLPAGEGYNGELLLSGRGLARCLIALHQRAEGEAILEQLLAWDPDEPDVRALLTELRDQPRDPTTSHFLPLLSADELQEPDADDSDEDDEDDPAESDEA